LRNHRRIQLLAWSWWSATQSRRSK